MAHYYGSVRGRARTTAHRLGTRTSGVATIAASWQGAVSVELYERDGVDMARVSLIPWRGTGVHLELYAGPVGGSELIEQTARVAS